MTIYQMTDAEKDHFLSGDLGRGEVRSSAARAYAGAESIQIIDSAGDLFDTVSGGEFVEGEGLDAPLAVVMTDDELEERRADDALRAADVERIESEIKPLVMQKLKDEARAEIRGEFRDIVRSQTQELALAKAEKSRLVAGMQSLQTKYNSLVAEFEALKANQ